jgi:N-acyl-phosphatidylethanolamine-hydrolysing phospholipase D
LRGLLKWQLVDRLTQPRPRDISRPISPVVESQIMNPRAAVDRVVITSVGHATFLIQIGGHNVLTDPMWSERASPVGFAGPRRLVPPGIAFKALPPIDVVLLSHNHYDHLDDRTVRRLVSHHPHAHWLTPLGLGPFLLRRGARDVVECDWWDETRVGSLAIGCTPAQHFSARGFGDRNRTLWCGWSVGAPARRLFFAGDSGYHPQFTAIGERFGPFDAALMPIGAYEPRWFMRPVHMNPEEAVRAFQDLQRSHLSSSGRPNVMVGMHWGTFKLTDEPMDEPPARARSAWQAAGLESVNLWLPIPGESRAL